MWLCRSTVWQRKNQHGRPGDWQGVQLDSVTSTTANVTYVYESDGAESGREFSTNRDPENAQDFIGRVAIGETRAVTKQSGLGLFTIRAHSLREGRTFDTLSIRRRRLDRPVFFDIDEDVHGTSTRVARIDNGVPARVIASVISSFAESAWADKTILLQYGHCQDAHRVDARNDRACPNGLAQCVS